MERHELGMGVLDWGRWERCVGRFGCVHLSEGYFNAGLVEQLEGTVGTLIAEVHAVRAPKSYFATIKLGDELTLGTGVLFSLPSLEEEEMSPRVGLLPKNSRNSEWLDSDELYRVHGQEVRLWFIPHPGRKHDALVALAKRFGLEPEDYRFPYVVSSASDERD